MTIHNIEFFHYYDNDDEFESTIVAMEKAAPWESSHIAITNHKQFIQVVNEIIEQHKAQLKYFTGLKIIAQYKSFTEIRNDATERGSLESIVNEFWKAYDED